VILLQNFIIILALGQVRGGLSSRLSCGVR